MNEAAQGNEAAQFLEPSEAAQPWLQHHKSHLSRDSALGLPSSPLYYRALSAEGIPTHFIPSPTVCICKRVKEESFSIPDLTGRINRKQIKPDKIRNSTLQGVTGTHRQTSRIWSGKVQSPVCPLTHRVSLPGP